ncbi:hypothetical protein [Tenacibaculum caenipelagi]|uniref:Lipocalin-like protein n=1 Tax=Tenacibaculum caenipelagi TaxID=1325435 RepID=A0A4R6TIB7_9FLAO|nr:hypothetical protein [Tenacibaculum caenipelagi]TDQ27581.1 hypothetical protein DFQ07_1432 [Tenacibaculum caenipelagi]
MNIKISLLFIIFLLLSCNKIGEHKNSIVGLWLVEKVKIGNEEMTPNARWVNFKKDSTQTSGNGWFQHSFGAWKLKGSLLSIENKNGISDTAEPFNVELKDETMKWSRIEDGENVVVLLKRINKIPTSKGNELLGLWKLKSNNFNDNGNINKVDDESTLFLKWDNTYVQQNSSEKKEFGIYKIHGHKPELQMVNYGENPKFKFYNFSLKDNILTLKLRDGDDELRYIRVHQFLQ